MNSHSIAHCYLLDQTDQEEIAKIHQVAASLKGVDIDDEEEGSEDEIELSNENESD